jgi:hypothetical protein
MHTIAGALDSGDRAHPLLGGQEGIEAALTMLTGGDEFLRSQAGINVRRPTCVQGNDDNGEVQTLGWYGIDLAAPGWNGAARPSRRVSGQPVQHRGAAGAQAGYRSLDYAGARRVPRRHRPIS